MNRVHQIDEGNLDALFDGTDLAPLLYGELAPLSRQPVLSRAPARVDGAYVIDEGKVDGVAAKTGLDVLLPSLRFDEVPWRSIVDR